MPLHCFAIITLTFLIGVTNAASQEEIICPGNVAFTTRNPAAEPHWNCSTTGDMQICSRAVPGSSIREVLAKAVIAAPSARVFAVISDDSRYPEFMPYVTESEIVKNEAGEFWVFQQLDLPWPISDRYYTIHLLDDLSCAAQGAYRLQWNLVRDDPSLRKGVGEPTLVNVGAWELQPDNTGTSTSVTYFIHTDPGGALPAWVINMANNVAVPKIIEAVRQRVQETQTRD